jgi:hypothetical protein
MNILVVSLYPLERNTSVANSSISIIKGLLALEHKVTVLMPQWHCNETGCDLSQLSVIRIPGKPDQPYNKKSKWLGKLHSHFDILDISRGYLNAIGDVVIPDEFFDVVISLADPKVSHIYTSELIRLKKIRYGRWIQHWGDPITGDFTRHYWWPEWVIRLYERSIIRKADKAVFVTPFTYEMECREHSNLREKIAFAPLPAEMLPIVECTKSDKLRLSYLGDYNPSIRNLKPLYDACANLDFVELTLAGHGPSYPSTKSITILPRIPQQQAAQIENNSDVLVCVCNITGTMIPGKATYKASTNKHILVAIEDYNYEAMRMYFEKYNRYIICRNTIESITEALLKIREMGQNDYTTPTQLLPINIAKDILS